ncbi:hypothetical protein FB451DRAFT_1549172 [Mycena latifolia]|nr:hypothetical protein FB451DRAFT_1549172 [Mycena latifolia]
MSPSQTRPTESTVIDSRLLCESTLAGSQTLEIKEFCTKYALSSKIRGRLEENEFETAEVLFTVTDAILKEAGFKLGQIAELKRALTQYASGVPSTSQSK